MRGDNWKTHWPLLHGNQIRPACNQWKMSNFKADNIEAKVTCKRCLKLLEKLRGHL